MTAAQLHRLHAALRHARFDRRLAGRPVQLGPGQWCADKYGVSADGVLAVLDVCAGRRGPQCVVMRWVHAHDGLRPTNDVFTRHSADLRRVSVLDGLTYEPANAASARAAALRLQSDGLTRLRMSRDLAQYSVATGRAWRSSPAVLLIPPIAKMAAATDTVLPVAATGVQRATAAQWSAATYNFWWTQVTAAYTRSQWSATTPICECCAARGIVASLTRLHIAADCPDWNALWHWARAALTRAGSPLPPDVSREQWLLFGCGIVDSPRVDVAVRIWGAALQAINGLMAGLRHDGVHFMPQAAPAMARGIVVRGASADLRRASQAENDYTVARWASKWSGLVRPRRNAAGYDVVKGW